MAMTKSSVHAGFHGAAVQITQSILHCIFVDERSNNTDVWQACELWRQATVRKISKAQNVQCLRAKALLGGNQGMRQQWWWLDSFTDYTQWWTWEVVDVTAHSFKLLLIVDASKKERNALNESSALCKSLTLHAASLTVCTVIHSAA